MRVILTTTTKILEPAPSPLLLQFISSELGDIKKWLAENLNRHQPLLIARARLPNGKLEGIFPEWADEIFSMDGVSTIVNEADGAADARIVPLINKVDLHRGLEKARKLAQCLLAADPIRIRRVVLGQLQQLPAVKEIVRV